MTTTPEERQRVVDAIRQRCVRESPEASQYEIRALALQLARSKLALNGRALAASLQRERDLLRAAAETLEGREVSVRAEVSERTATLREVGSSPLGDVQPTEGQTVSGYYARWDASAEIVSEREGWFVENIARGAFAESIARKPPKPLFHHGKDSIGMRPLGTFTELREDAVGGRFELRMTATSYAGDIAAMTRDGLLGSSVGFIVRGASGERWSMPATATRQNPQRLPERTVVAGELLEISLTGWPAYDLGPLAVRSQNIATSVPRDSRRGMTEAQRAAVVRRIQIQQRGITPRKTRRYNR